jgi:hypothetical protein
MADDAEHRGGGEHAERTDDDEQQEDDHGLTLAATRRSTGDEPLL